MSNTATITVAVRGREFNFTLENIDLDENRNDFALRVGRAVVDSIWEGVEG